MCKELSLFPDETEKDTTDWNDIELSPLFDRLAKSSFRSSFYLNSKDHDYIHTKGWRKIELDTRAIIAKRLAPANIPNDGRQTPMRHGIFPPFIAQHATACCCRGCLEKWHGITKGKELSSSEQDYIVHVIMKWLHQKHDTI